VTTREKLSTPPRLLPVSTIDASPAGVYPRARLEME